MPLRSIGLLRDRRRARCNQQRLLLDATGRARKPPQHNGASTTADRTLQRSMARAVTQLTDGAEYQLREPSFRSRPSHLLGVITDIQSPRLGAPGQRSDSSAELDEVLRRGLRADPVGPILITPSAPAAVDSASVVHRSSNSQLWQRFTTERRSCRASPAAVPPSPTRRRAPAPESVAVGESH